MKYFGTDGIRDKVEGPLLKPESVFKIGRAIGQWLNKNCGSNTKHVAIGRDTRGSAGYIFLSLARGLDTEGIRVFDTGICPTPAVASSVRMLGLSMGIVITASHNPGTDNGIKLFTKGGCKLRVEEEEEIEALIETLSAVKENMADTPAVRYFEARRHYLEIYRHLLPEKSLMGLRIVLDCANGATYRSSGELLTDMGAQVISIGSEPDGSNINEGVGSEYPEVMAKAVVEHSADLGIAHDGDGDRVIFCDHQGAVLDGDAILAILGCGWASRDHLAGRTVVATIMSNLGLDRCLADRQVKLRRTGVGDRQVYYEMVSGGYQLGGESSGHFISTQHLPTGDGLLAALLVLNEMRFTESTIQKLAAIFRPFPQLKKNLPVRKKPVLEDNPDLQSALKALENKLGDRGRILLRYSGTEAKVRLLAEAEDSDLSQSTMDELQQIVQEFLPLK